jgi:hypothetical protein
MLALNNRTVFGAPVYRCIFRTKRGKMLIEVMSDPVDATRQEIVPRSAPQGLGAYNLQRSGLGLLYGVEFKIGVHECLILFGGVLGQFLLEVLVVQPLCAFVEDEVDLIIGHNGGVAIHR